MGDDQEPKATIEDIDEGEKAARRFAPLLMVRGVIGIVAGIVLLFWPGTGLAVAAVALGIFLVVDGVERLIAVLRRPADTGKTDALALAGALLRIVFGAAVLLNPSAAGGLWASALFIIAGLNLVAGSLFLLWRDRSLRDEPLDLGAAILMMILGLLMVLMPMVSAMILLRLLGVVLVLIAVPSLSLGLRSRN